jgi:hypothetical protein
MPQSTLTWRQILNRLNQLTEEQLDMEATVYDHWEEEYYPINDLDVADCTDVLDEMTPFIVYNKGL